LGGVVLLVVVVVVVTTGKQSQNPGLAWDGSLTIMINKNASIDEHLEWC
jgi:hypothetical protein